MGRETVHTDDAPPAVADYNRATVTDGLSFTAGQVAPTPDGESPADGPVDVRAGQVLENLEAVLSAAGSGLGSAVETTVYPADIDDYGAVTEVYGESFDSDLPARSAVEAVNLPPGTAVEMAAVATGA
jgi:reactive intermediate/imine deaminase